MLEIHQTLNMKAIKWLSTPSPEIKQKYSSFVKNISITSIISVTQLVSLEVILLTWIFNKEREKEKVNFDISFSIIP